MKKINFEKYLSETVIEINCNEKEVMTYENGEINYDDSHFTMVNFKNQITVPTNDLESFDLSMQYAIL